jgi:hypothetical protein
MTADRICLIAALAIVAIGIALFVAAAPFA